MNESGEAVAPLARYFKIELDRVLVVHDDIDLPFLKLRVQHGGGSGGNKGVASIVRSLGDQGFWRLKCGVGRPPSRTKVESFVLKRFTKAERRSVDLIIPCAAEVAELFASQGGHEARQRAGEVNVAGPWQDS